MDDCEAIKKIFYCLNFFHHGGMKFLQFPFLFPLVLNFFKKSELGILKPPFSLLGFCVAGTIWSIQRNYGQYMQKKSKRKMSFAFNSCLTFTFADCKCKCISQNLISFDICIFKCSRNVFFISKHFRFVFSYECFSSLGWLDIQRMTLTWQGNHQKYF